MLDATTGSAGAVFASTAASGAAMLDATTGSAGAMLASTAASGSSPAADTAAAPATASRGPSCWSVSGTS
eukprot:5910920-Alexandrium_andersonii.AAC.1